MFVIFFYDNKTNQIKVHDLGTSLEDVEKKMIQFGKDYIENENGRKHMETCIKSEVDDLNKEKDGYYLIKTIEDLKLVKVKLLHKTTIVDEVKGWTGLYKNLRTEIKDCGYFSYTNFDQKLLQIYSQTNVPKTIQPKVETKPISTGGFDSVIQSLKSNGFKPNKDCRFKFDIKRKEEPKYPDIIIKEEDINIFDISNLSKKIQSIPNLKYSEDEYICESVSDNERFDLLANSASFIKFDDDFSDLSEEYIYTDEADYDNSKETMLQKELAELDLMNKPFSKLGSISFIRKQWKLD
jgi:hypothetical protein